MKRPDMTDILLTDEKTISVDKKTFQHYLNTVILKAQ